MEIDFTALEPKHAYAWMVGMITPRPIAWVSTISEGGKTNLAPFSFFTGVTSNPPTLMFVPVNNREGHPKDTLRNIQATKEFVVNVVQDALVEPMNACAALLPHGESEFEAFGIGQEPSLLVKPPRVAAAPVSMECVLHQIVPVGEGPLAASIVIGKILRAVVADSVLDEKGRIDAGKLDTIGRMGGEDYCRTRERFQVKRPDRK